MQVGNFVAEASGDRKEEEEEEEWTTPGVIN